MAPSKVLVVAAHPDDETLGMGGTILRLARAGAAVHLVVLTAATFARYGVPGATGARRREACDAAEVLGIAHLDFWDYPEVEICHAAISQIAARIRAKLDVFLPEEVYCPHWADLNQDHRTAAEAATIAVRPHTAPSVQRLLAYPVDGLLWGAVLTPRFNYFVDVSGYIEAKGEALDKYVSELRLPPHPRSKEYIRGLAQMWGHRMGVLAAEPFEVVWERGA